jgi:zinc D-Ala-D-Ala carboxypeptidase
MQLSKHFSLEEMTFSETAIRLGIPNEPEDYHIANLRLLCNELLEPVREILDRPIFVNSGFRCWELNSALDGSSTSEHPEGRAVDFRVLGMTPYEVCQKLVENQARLRFNQLILEFDRWTHLSVPKAGVDPKREIMTFRMVNGHTRRTYGISKK